MVGVKPSRSSARTHSTSRPSGPIERGMGALVHSGRTSGQRLAKRHPTTSTELSTGAAVELLSAAECPEPLKWAGSGAESMSNRV